MKYRKSVRKMKRELRKRHTKEGGSRRKRKRQTRKKQRKAMVGGNRTVKYDEWRIHRKYSRVNYKDGGDFDFDKYDNEYKGDRIIHVWRRQIGDSYEHSLQVLDVEALEIDISVVLNTIDDGKNRKTMLTEFLDKIGDGKNISGKIGKLPISDVEWFLLNLKELERNPDKPQFIGKYDPERGKDNSVEEMKDIIDSIKKKIEGILTVLINENNIKKDDNKYYTTLIIYYMNAIFKGYPINFINKPGGGSNFLSGAEKLFNNLKNPAHSSAYLKIDRDYEWLSHWVLNSGLFNDTPYTAASADATASVGATAASATVSDTSKKIPVPVSATLKIPNDNSKTAKTAATLGVVAKTVETASIFA